jgi:hypothetical protein
MVSNVPMYLLVIEDIHNTLINIYIYISKNIEIQLAQEYARQLTIMKGSGIDIDFTQTHM